MYICVVCIHVVACVHMLWDVYMHVVACGVCACANTYAMQHVKKVGM